MVNGGKQFRLNRLLKNGRLFCVPLDHGVTDGAIGHLKDINFCIKSVLEGGASAVVLHKGMVKKYTIPSSLGLFIHISASTVLGPDYNRKSVVTSVEKAIALGADGISIHVNIGSQYENEMLIDLGFIAEECDRFSIPLMAMTYIRPEPKIEKEIKEPVKIAHAARIASELGADIVKVSYPGSADGVKIIVSACPVPVVIAGGECKPSEIDALVMAEESIKGEALGISFGRNIFKRKDMVFMVRALSYIVYKGMSAKNALKHAQKK